MTDMAKAPDGRCWSEWDYPDFLRLQASKCESEGQPELAILWRGAARQIEIGSAATRPAEAAQVGDYTTQWLLVCRRALEDVSTQFRATGQDDSRFVRLIESMPRTTPPPASDDASGEQDSGGEVFLSTDERKAIEALLDTAYRAWCLADNTEDDGERLTVEQADFAAMSEALDELDTLPDDQPGYTMESAAKARWTLRRLLDTAAEQPAKGEGKCPDCEEGWCHFDSGVRQYRRECKTCAGSGYATPQPSDSADAAPFRLMVEHKDHVVTYVEGDTPTAMFDKTGAKVTPLYRHPAQRPEGDARGHIAMLRSLRMMYDDGVMEAEDHPGTVSALDFAIAAISTPPSADGGTAAWRAIAAEAYREWDGDNDSRVGKLLRAMSDPEFAKTYRPDIAALHGAPSAEPHAGVVEDAMVKRAAMACARRAYGYYKGGSAGSGDALAYFDDGLGAAGRRSLASYMEAEFRAALTNAPGAATNSVKP